MGARWAILLSLVLWGHWSVGAIGQGQKDSSIGASDDCTDISIAYKNAENLTKQERIELMDKALFGSLSKYERCALQHLQETSASSSGGGAAGASGQGQGASSSNGGSAGASAENADGQDGSDDPSGGSSGSSVASSNLSGTEKPAEEAGGTAGFDGEADGSIGADGIGGGQSSPDAASLAGGKLPEDIPPADNDSALEEQIRHAAMNEPDPVIRERLWNEYRKYKGLPVKESKQDREGLGDAN